MCVLMVDACYNTEINLRSHVIEKLHHCYIFVLDCCPTYLINILRSYLVRATEPIVLWG